MGVMQGCVVPSAAQEVGVEPVTEDGRATVSTFDTVVVDHHRELARFAYRLCGDRAQAEDVVAEAYARVWPRWRRGRVESLVPYLMRTIANEVYGHSRRRSILQRKAPPLSPEVQGSFEGQVDDRASLWSALGLLPSQQRVVVVLRVVEDLSEEQTAEMLGVARGTVKSRLSRGLTELRSVMEGQR